MFSPFIQQQAVARSFYEEPGVFMGRCDPTRRRTELGLKGGGEVGGEGGRLVETAFQAF